VRIRETLHALITRDSPSGQWTAWCPTLDIMTCGEHPDHAAAMLEEACQMVVSESIQDSWTSHYSLETKRKKVVHPLRLGITAELDEAWGTYQLQLEAQKSDELQLFQLKSLSDGLDEVIFVEGYLEIECRSGVPKVYVGFNDYVWVPAVRFTLEYTQAYPRKRKFEIRESLLRQAGNGADAIIQSEVKDYVRRAGDVVGEVKVIREGHQGQRDSGPSEV